MNEELEIVANDGVIIRARVYGPEEAVRLVISHGNGLAIGGYESYWSELINQFQVVLLDFRGHGNSDNGAIERHSWEQFDQDLETILVSIEKELGARKTYGIFHSLSAIVSLRHTRAFGSRWAGLLLFDPPIIPPDGHPLQSLHVKEMLGLADRVRKRQGLFETPKALADQFRRARMLSRWLPPAFDQMARAVLREETDNGRWRLSCPPTFEAKIFESNDDTSLWPWLAKTGVRLKFVCADPGVPGVQPSALIGSVAAKEFDLDYEYIDGTTHFLQLERPDICASITRKFCTGNT